MNYILLLHRAFFGCNTIVEFILLFGQLEMKR